MNTERDLRKGRSTLCIGQPIAQPHSEAPTCIDAAMADRMPAGGIDLPELLRELQPTTSRYQRTLLHASGGMGSVWLAHDANIGRDVALKELRPDSAREASAASRFLSEARITGRLEHPGIVPVYDIGRDPATGQPFYTMRFVRGRTLTQAALAFHRRRQAGENEPLEFVNLLSAFVSVCQTIAYAHSRGVIHRDLKGENVLIGDFGEVIVLDWGLARRLDREEGETSAESEWEGDLSQLPAGQTMMGQVMGTPACMAPEQALGQLDQIGPCTDIFGAGAILYEILTGQPPFTGTDTAAVLKLARQAEVTPPRTCWPEVPPCLEAICLKALSKAPADRHESATKLAQAVQGWQDQQRRRAEDELRQAGERLMKQQAALVKLTRSEVFATPELSQTFHRMIEASAETLGVERVSVWSYTSDRRAILCRLLYERSTGKTLSGMELHEVDFPSYFQALQTSEVIAAHDAHADPRTREFSASYLTPLGIGAIMDAPIHVDGAMQGVVCHEHIGPARRWTPDEQLFAIAIANLVAQAITQRGY